MIALDEFLDLVTSYNKNSDRARLGHAFQYCITAHGEDHRVSGEPYYMHPIEVARILIELHLDDTTIITALLHDVLEDTAITIDIMREEFGDEVARLVDGVTKLGKYQFDSHEQAQAENFRKFMLATTEDVRVLLVKLADRTHNMRTLYALRPEKRLRIARETMEIYAPLASRMGIAQMREELEDLAFAELNPEARMSVLRRFVSLRRSRGDIIGDITEKLSDIMREDGIASRIVGRGKMPYSVWRKMQTHDITFEQLSDVAGFRLITDNEDQCYRALGAVHRRWPLVMGRFKDYISSPKPNGYRSIHTTVVAPGGMRVEIQIRSQAMHEVAETGVAAHWAYKDDIRVENPFAVDPFRWLRDLAEQLENGDRPSDFLKHFKLEMYQDQVYCFTPRGDVIGLPRGATPLDFAYAVHTQIGDQCVGAKIDGSKKPLWTRLRTGQQVEIICSTMQRPAREWESWVTTGRARSAIGRALREIERSEFVQLGRHLLNSCATAEGHEMNAKLYKQAAQKFKLGKNSELLLEKVGRGTLSAQQIIFTLFAKDRPKNQTSAASSLQQQSPSADKAADSEEVQNGTVISYAKCCSPLPGEQIIGLPRKGGGIELHRIHCPILMEIGGDSESWIHLTWKDLHPKSYYPVQLDVALAHVPGALGRVCGVIGNACANIENIEFIERRPDFFRTRIDLAVNDVAHLENIVDNISVLDTVESVTRLSQSGKGEINAPRLDST